MGSCAELNLWRVKVSVPLAICVWIRTLSLPQLFLPFPVPSLSISQVARATTHKNNDGVVPHPHPLSGAELVLSPLYCSLQVVSRLCLYPKCKYQFSPLSCLANLLDSSLTQALWAVPAPPSRTAARAWCTFFSLSQFPQTYSTVLPCHRQRLDHLTNHDTPSATAHRSMMPWCGPSCAMGRSGGERAATVSHTPVTRMFWGGNQTMHKDDHVDMTSTTAPTGQQCNMHDDDDECNDGSGDAMQTDGGSGGV